MYIGQNLFGEQETYSTMSYNVDDYGTLRIYLDDYGLAQISECDNMSEVQIKDLIEEVLFENDIIWQD